MFAVVHFPLQKESQKIEYENLIALADRVSPLYEIIDERTVAVNIDGLKLVFPGGRAEIMSILEDECAESGWTANIAIGDRLSQTVIAAICLTGSNDIGSGEILQSIELRNLPLATKYKQIFAEWGLDTVSQLLEIPATELISRLGRDIGSYLQQLTGSSPQRPINPPRENRRFLEKIVLDDPVETVSSCLFLIEDKLQILIGELSKYALSASVVIVRAYTSRDDFHTIELNLPIPSLNLRYLVKLLGFEFENFTSDDLIRHLEVEIVSAAPRHTQLAFWKPPEPTPENLELTLAKLKNLLGSKNVGIPVIKDSYNPSAFETDETSRPTGKEIAEDEIKQLECLIMFRYFLKKIPVKFIKSVSQPFYLKIENTRRRILRINGPWRSSGDWWDAKRLWVRSEMDVELEGGQVFRIIESQGGDFFAEGYYD